MTCNTQTIVIADDITGAAEIAGIGLQFGLRVNLVMYMGDDNIELQGHCDLLVFATDTRSMNEQESIEETTRLCKLITKMGYAGIFKKTDSALRGHIISELKILMEATGKSEALLLPQNPSRGRTIENGTYYIDKVPLHETSFAYDPEFPAKISNISKLCLGTLILPAGKSIEGNNICIGEAATQQEIMLHLATINEEVLLAGGADFFTAYLLTKGHALKSKPKFNGLGNNSAVIVLGSTVKHPIMDFGYIQRQHTPICNMPSLLFYRKASKRWIEKVGRVYTKHNSVILQSNHPPKRGRNYALNLREHTGEVVQALVSEYHPQELIIEGGSTAFSILKRLEWKVFDIQCEVAPGVIRMTPIINKEITVTLKPGSYQWGDLFQ